jgi:hypothetical protein
VAGLGDRGTYWTAQVAASKEMRSRARAERPAFTAYAGAVISAVKNERVKAEPGLFS